ncbi:Ras-related protein Rab-6A [Nematocida displodere]|uniref:Ras-related protein Rab-6A n=1 Tax=Nematocida displodere TaxID=1805483 RepID=A0A177EI93_9MICR|nr:Ras-related protein Rab-6A [Nematocida displodere]
MIKQTKREVLPKYKIVFLGDTAVGKTMLVTRYVFSTETKDYQPTIGVDFFAQKTEIGGKQVNLQLWDTAGQERFRSLIPNYARDSFMAVILFDLTVRETFDRVDLWIKEFVQRNNGSKVNILLVGNKSDLRQGCTDPNLPTRAEAEEKAKLYGAEYIETCAISKEGMQSLADAIARAVETSTAPENHVTEFSVEAEVSNRCLCI